MATKRKKRSAPRKVVVVSKTKHRRRRVSGTSVGRTHHKPRKRRRVSGAVGRTHRPRRKRRSVGATMSMNTLKEIAKMAIGATAGVAANNLIIYPAEKMISDRMPMAGKAMGFLQAVLGGVITLKAKGNMGKAFGLTILAGGAQAIVRQFKLGDHIPGISGPNDEYTTLKIPVAGNNQLTSMVAGILDSNQTPNLPYVANTGGGHYRGSSHYRHHSRANNSGMENSGGNRNNDPRMKSYVAGDGDDLLLGKV